MPESFFCPYCNGLADWDYSRLDSVPDDVTPYKCTQCEVELLIDECLVGPEPGKARYKRGEVSAVFSCSHHDVLIAKGFELVDMIPYKQARR